MTNPMHILLVGCGNMGSALLTRWQHAHKIEVVEPNFAHAGWHKNLESLSADFVPEVIVFAVKPQNLAEILPAYKIRFGDKPLYISIAAGKTTAFFKKYLGEHVHIVRVMPNTPAMVGAGMSVLYAASTLPASARHIATELIQAVGKADWVEDETLMDAATALSGSGPAYVFLFLEALTKAGIATGLSEAAARKLALETVHGSTALAAQSSESFAQLRKNVTSPGGTTEAALNVLMQDNALEKLIKDAVLAAQKQAKKLAE